jgi:hypothetical protein
MAILLAAITTGGVIAIVVRTVGVIAGAFYAIVNVSMKVGGLSSMKERAVSSGRSGASVVGASRVW